MSVKFPNLSWWLWSGKKKDAKLHKRSSIKSSPKLNMMEVDMVKFPAVNGTEKARRKRRCYEEGKIDKELNVVLVSSDGGCSSDSESDSSDWSIGWSEPHAPGFLSEDEIDGGFGVLVRCYGNFSGSKQDHGKDVADGTANVPALYSADSKKYMERWLSSLQEN